jgi:hypothetical protein
MTLAEKLAAINAAKQMIRAAILNKNVEMPYDTPFSRFASYIERISGAGGGVGGGLPIPTFGALAGGLSAETGEAGGAGFAGTLPAFSPHVGSAAVPTARAFSAALGHRFPPVQSAELAGAVSVCVPLDGAPVPTFAASDGILFLEE